MPTNVTAEYKKAEQAFRQARDPHERLECLKEMLRTLPKHKGTEHLQADIKTRIRQLSDDLVGAKKGGSRAAPVYAVPPEGAAQVCLLGSPNAGKSSLHVRLTGSHTAVGPYPYTTKLPVPGMLAYEDVHFQLVDLPPISAEFMEPWFGNALERADAAFLVVDVSDPDCVDHVTAIRARLAEKHITLAEEWPGLPTEGGPAIPSSAARTGEEETEAEEISSPFGIHLPTVLVANKSDLTPDPDEVRVLEELLDVRFPAIAVSAKTGQGLSQLGAVLFRGLGIIRVYTKVPGRPAERERPFTMRRGATVLEVAELVHKDIARALSFARIWGSGQFDGQHVGPHHQVGDRDIVELHTQ